MIQYNADEVFAAAASLAARGWKVVKIYGLRDDLSCTCARGRSCPSAGKHPVDHEWQTTATDDENTIAGWFENTNANVRWNIGVRLGASSGIIDVEADDDNALRVMQEYGLDKIYTTAYQGSRGPHYLFEYEEALPASGVVKVDGLEVRIGGGEKGTQSVFPMSWHKTGVQYKWLPGRSPDEVLPAKLPAKFLERVFQKSRQGTGGAVAQAREVCAGGGEGEVMKVSTGGRHAFLVGLASRYCWLIRPEYTEEHKREVCDWMLSQNDRHCDPPKSRDEVVAIVNSQFAFYMARAEERRVRRPLAAYRGAPRPPPGGLRGRVPASRVQDLREDGELPPGLSQEVRGLKLRRRRTGGDRHSTVDQEPPDGPGRVAHQVGDHVGGRLQEIPVRDEPRRDRPASPPVAGRDAGPRSVHGSPRDGRGQPQPVDRLVRRAPPRPGEVVDRMKQAASYIGDQQTQNALNLKSKVQTHHFRVRSPFHVRV